MMVVPLGLLIVQSCRRAGSSPLRDRLQRVDRRSWAYTWFSIRHALRKWLLFSSQLRSTSGAFETLASYEIMKGSLEQGNPALAIRRRHMAQSKFDIVEIASEAARHFGGDGPLLLLFEWSQVTSSPFEAPSAGAIQHWKKMALPISRAALIHDQKRKQRAAILAAVVRVGAPRGGQIFSSAGLRQVGRMARWKAAIAAI